MGYPTPSTRRVMPKANIPSVRDSILLLPNSILKAGFPASSMIIRLSTGCMKKASICRKDRKNSQGKPSHHLTPDDDYMITIRRAGTHGFPGRAGAREQELK